MNAEKSEPDVTDLSNRKWQVRATHLPKGGLILRPHDTVDMLYILVIGEGKHWRIVGFAAPGYIKSAGIFEPDWGRKPYWRLSQKLVRDMAFLPQFAHHADE